MTSYIGESDLTGLILEFASTHWPGIAGVTLEYQEPDAIGCNWRVAAALPESHEAARAAIDHVAACNRDKWVMVPDDSELAGQVALKPRMG